MPTDGVPAADCRIIDSGHIRARDLALARRISELAAGMGVAADPAYPLDGVSLLPVLRDFLAGDEEPHGQADRDEGYDDAGPGPPRGDRTVARVTRFCAKYDIEL